MFSCLCFNYIYTGFALHSHITIMNFQMHLYDGGCNAVSSINIPGLWRGILEIHHDTVLHPIASPGSAPVGWACKVCLNSAQTVTVTVYANKTLMIQGRKEAVLDWIDSTVPMLLAETADYRLTRKGEKHWR